MLTHLVTVFKNGKIKHGLCVHRKEERINFINSQYLLLWARCLTHMIHFIFPPTPGDREMGQNIPPANMPLWYKDYFKLKAPKKTAGARRTYLPHLHFLPEGRRWNAHVKVALPIPGGEKYSYYQRQSRDQDGCIQTDLAKIFICFNLPIHFSYSSTTASLCSTILAFRFCYFFGFYSFMRALMLHKTEIK